MTVDPAVDSLAPPLPREDFALEPGLVYFNCAAAGLLPVRTRDALLDAVADQARRGILGVWKVEQQIDTQRTRTGALINASGDDIAFLRNTTDGANVIARGLDWRPGDEIVVSDNEFGANAMPWLALREEGVIIRFIETARERLTPGVLERVMTPRTRLVAVSWVSFIDGYRHDLAGLARVAHAGGALLCVDAIQALGGFGVDVRATGIDALYAGGQKWMLALAGASFVYVEPGLRERLRVRWRGWRDVVDMWDFLNYDQPLAPNAVRLEGGTLNFLGLHAIGISAQYLREIGLHRIGEHVLALTDYLVERLQGTGAHVLSLRGSGISSGIVTFRMPGVDPVAQGKALQAAGIVTTYRANGIRLSLHGYNTRADVDALLEKVAQ